MRRITACSPRRSTGPGARRPQAPLRYLGSYTNIVNGVSFYLPRPPSTLDIVGPRVDAVGGRGERRARRHRAGLPGAGDDLHAFPQCTRARQLPRHAVTLSRRHWGVGDKPVRYVIVVVPPAN